MIHGRGARRRSAAWGYASTGVSATIPRVTPMLRQYFEMKSRVPDAILFYRMGDFYEMFFDDAKDAAPLLGIALTARHRDSDIEAPDVRGPAPGRRAPRGPAGGGRAQGRDLRPGRGPPRGEGPRAAGHHAGRHARHRARSGVARAERRVLPRGAASRRRRVGRGLPGPLDGPLSRGRRAAVAGRGRPRSLPAPGDPSARRRAGPGLSRDAFAPRRDVVERLRRRCRRGGRRRGPGLRRADAAGRAVPRGSRRAPLLRPPHGPRRRGDRHARALRVLGRIAGEKPLRASGPHAHAARSSSAAGSARASVARPGGARVSLGRGRRTDPAPGRRPGPPGGPRRRRRSRAPVRADRHGHRGAARGRRPGRRAEGGAARGRRRRRPLGRAISLALRVDSGHGGLRASGRGHALAGASRGRLRRRRHPGRGRRRARLPPGPAARRPERPARRRGRGAQALGHRVGAGEVQPRLRVLARGRQRPQGQGARRLDPAPVACQRGALRHSGPQGPRGEDPRRRGPHRRDRGPPLRGPPGLPRDGGGARRPDGLGAGGARPLRLVRGRRALGPVGAAEALGGAAPGDLGRAAPARRAPAPRGGLRPQRHGPGRRAAHPGRDGAEHGRQVDVPAAGRDHRAAGPGGLFRTGRGRGALALRPRSSPASAPPTTCRAASRRSWSRCSSPPRSCERPRTGAS